MNAARIPNASGEIADLAALGIPGPYGPRADGKEGVAGSSPAEGFAYGFVRRAQRACVTVAGRWG